MDFVSVVQKNREKIAEELKTAFSGYVLCGGRVSFTVYVSEDGDAFTHESVGESFLSGEKLIPIHTFSGRFDLLGFWDGVSAPDESEIAEWLTDNYDPEYDIEKAIESLAAFGGAK